MDKMRQSARVEKQINYYRKITIDLYAIKLVMNKIN